MPTSASTYVILLRGVNVSGKNRVPMTTLVTLCERAGCRDVRTYIQSGNAVLRASARLAKKLPALLSTAIERELGVRVPVVVRSGKELHSVATQNPFLKAGEDPKHLYVAFLQDKPSGAAANALDPKRSPPDRFELRGRELFLCLPNGVGRSKLTSEYLDRSLGSVATIRNWNTVLKLDALAGD